ncbi:hypothetical protein AB0P15_36165 [Streptomyces sp. NPDC087917]|uniref:hypothetical protein n=1 Tax=Streptomyces sp. NPDC087917 TaxID=3155060 RepID=UPI00341A8626
MDRSTVADLPWREYRWETASDCQDDWYGHVTAVADTTIPLPAELETLLQDVAAAIDRLAQDSPTAAVKAARSLEIIAQRSAHWPAQSARGLDPETRAAALGLNVEETRTLLARFGGWSADA